MVRVLVFALALCIPAGFLARPALPSPRTPPTLEELVLASDLIVEVETAAPPERAGDWYRAEAQLVFKGEAPAGALHIQAAIPYMGLARGDLPMPAAGEAGAKRLLLFLKETETPGRYYTDTYHRLPAARLVFGFDRPCAAGDVGPALRALVELNRPDLSEAEAARLWIQGLQGENACLLEALVERVEGVSYGETRTRIERQRDLARLDLATALIRLVAHRAALVRGSAALHLPNLVLGVEEAKARTALRTQAIAALRARLRDPETEVRRHVLGALAELGDAAVRPRILALLADDRAPTREREAALWAVEYLTKADASQKGEDLIDGLLGVLDHPKLAGYAVAVLRRQTGDVGRRTVAQWRAFRDARRR